jgi:hypothetical protein
MWWCTRGKERYLDRTTTLTFCVSAYDVCWHTPAAYTCLHPVCRYTAAGCPPCVGTPLLLVPRVSVSPAAGIPQLHMSRVPAYPSCRYTPAAHVPCAGIPQLHACLPRVLVVPRVLVHRCCLYLVCRFPQLPAYPSCICPVCRHTPAACLPRVLDYPNCVPHNPCAVKPRLAVLCIPQPAAPRIPQMPPPRACHFEDASMPGDDDPDAEPFVQSIHLLFPWATDVLGILAPNLFLDATFNVTIYGFKVVAITTLDGNRQHRPLQVGSIACPTCSGRVVTVGVIHHENRWRSVGGPPRPLLEVCPPPPPAPPRLLST